jgi:hypothetical protein
MPDFTDWDNHAFQEPLPPPPPNPSAQAEFAELIAQLHVNNEAALAQILEAQATQAALQANNIVINEPTLTDDYFYMPKYTSTNLYRSRSGGDMDVIRSKKYIIEDVDPEEYKFNSVGEMINKKEEIVELTSEEKKVGRVSSLREYFLQGLRGPMYGTIPMMNIGEIFEGRLKKDKPWTKYILMGLILNGKMYTDNKEARVITGSKKLEKEAEYVVYDVDSKKIERYTRTLVDYNMRYIDSADVARERMFFNGFQYRVKDSVLSGKMFGYGNIKKDLVGKVLPAMFDFGSSQKLGADTFFAVIYHADKDRSIKFALADLEVVLPSLKGYNFPKDKTIRQGCKVILKGNKDQIYTVQQVWENKSSKRVSKRSMNRLLDVVMVQASNGLSQKTYAKNVKVIN